MGAQYAIVAQDQLVIHAGELIPKDEARVLMRGEFPPHGYTYSEIETLLERAYKATQKFLGELRDFDCGERRNELLDVALGKDRRAAERWRAYWREHPEQNWAGYQAAKAEKEAKRKAEQEAYAAEVRQRWKERADQYKRMLAEEQERTDREMRKAARQREFEAWTDQNESGGRKATAAERAEARRQSDQRKWQAILCRIREKHGNESYWVPQLERGGTQDAMLGLLTDGEYIGWMFRCHERGLTF